MGKEARKRTGSTEQQFLISPQYEEELDRIRTEGDLALIKVQTERKRLAEIEAKLAEANKQLRERKKKQVEQLVEAKQTAKGEGFLVALVLSARNGAKAAKQVPVIREPNDKERESKTAKRVPVNAGRKLQTEERLKVALAERTAELQSLRYLIDETRRKRLDALATETEMLKDVREDEEDMKRAQAETAELKRRAAGMKSEIAETELEFDTEKQAYRLERQRLLLEVEEIVKAEKGSQDQPAPVSRKYSVFHNNIVHRRKHVRTSKWKKVNLEQKLVSFEQKKRLLDRIIEETCVKTLSEFIHKYNEQERTKAEIFARIETQTATNEAMNESIAQLTDDIARLSGADENDSASDDAELQKLLDLDDIRIKRWTNDADIFAEAVKCLRDPIYDIYKEFFPDERNEDVFDSAATRESGMMRRIGAIEERIMQFIMAKILEETASTTPNNSDTLRRLRQYQGRREQRDSATLTLSKLCGVEPPSTLNAQRLKDCKAVPEDDEGEDTDENPATTVRVMHSDIFRQKFKTTTTSEGDKGAGGSSPTRKNATTVLNL